MGGDINYFPRNGVVKPFAKAAFAVPAPYQMSDVVQTPFGYHLILVTDHKAGIEVKFEEAKDQVREVFCDASATRSSPNTSPRADHGGAGTSEVTCGAERE